MRARTAIGWTAHRVRLTAAGWGVTAVLACVALSACTSSPPAYNTSTPSASVSVLSPSASGAASASASYTPSPSASPSPSPDASPTLPPTPSYSPYPTAAPVTGGGGTAGFQDAGLAVLGGAAIVAGLGSIVYRQRITRNR